MPKVRVGAMRGAGPAAAPFNARLGTGDTTGAGLHDSSALTELNAA
jgi:hypothetical protein